MNQHLQVSLSRKAPDAPRDSTAAFLLDPAGAQRMLGDPGADRPGGGFGDVAPIVAAADTLFGPRGACAADDGSIWVCDTGHHRVLAWRSRPLADGQPCDLLFGQPGFDREGRNARGPVNAGTFNVPTGIATCGEGLLVADAWNHRVLIWHRRPDASHRHPDVVLGQPGFDTAEANRGRSHPRADTLFWPYCVAWDGTRLWVADTGNRRVLMWNSLPQRHGAAADLVLGQASFGCRDENGGHAANACSMRWPHAITFPVGGLCVADAGNNRLMLWERQPRRDNLACDRILGQPDAHATEHNRGRYDPDGRALNMPYGAVTVGDRLIVADTANSRLLGWNCAWLPDNDAAAVAVAAQPDMVSKGDNRWRAPQRDSVCWPYAVAAHGDTLIVADTGNHRILFWQLMATTTSSPAQR